MGAFGDQPQGQGRGVLRSGQEVPYQGGDEEHGQGDQQQTGNFPAPNAQPGLRDMRQIGQVVVVGAEISSVSTGTEPRGSENFRTRSGWGAGSNTSGVCKYHLNSEKRHAGVSGTGGPQLLPSALGSPELTHRGS